MSNLITPIRTYLRTRRHKKEYKKIQDGLLNDPKLLSETQVKFEAQFGKDQNRTATQWKNLVRVYGMATVCEKEGMTESLVIQRCNESNRNRISRILREKK